MRMRIQLAVLAAIVLGLLGACTSMPAQQVAKPGAPAYSCYRHIYNNSSCAWTFSFDTDSGNVYLGDGTLPNCTQQNGPCTIPPGNTIPIQYTTSGGLISGHVTIVSAGATQSYYQRYANDPGSNFCPYVQHDGNTGDVAMNDPANGDFNAGACN
jgi:hypothetical protein